MASTISALTDLPFSAARSETRSLKPGGIRIMYWSPALAGCFAFFPAITKIPIYIV
jgi:hypothetical protein